MLSVIILTKNEENNIIDCLDSVDFADEILIIDDNSIDNTIALIESRKSNSIKVLKHNLDNDFSQQRNFALKHVKNDWVLFVDADERISKELQKEIIQTLENPAFDGYFVKRIDTMWAKELQYGEVNNIWLLRLGKKNAGKWAGKVHETWNISNTAHLHASLNHFPHPTIAEFLTEINKYTSIRAKELYDQNNTVTTLDIICFPFGKFLYTYILKLGFLDGIEGLVLSILMSFHSFLVRGKLWSLYNK